MPRLHVNARHRFGSLRRGTSGNVSILFALSLIPMVGLVGLGIDYGMALNAKAKLDNAADAAAIAAVATAKAYIAANSGSLTDPTLTTNAKTAGQTRGVTAFAVNAGTSSYTPTPTPVVNVTRSGQTFSSTVQYQTSSKSNFGQLFKQPQISVAGSTSAAADIPSYLDFYLLVDVSGSMGLPSTLDGQNTLAANNSGCQFACHFPGSDGSGYAYATTHNIQLRSGAVNTAVCGLLTLAAAPSVPKQYRVGLYPFITQMATLSPITASISASQTAATCSASPPTAFTTLLDTGATQLTTSNDPSTGVGSGGTHFETSLPTLQTKISPYGDGSSQSNSRPFVFLITDGMENGQFFGQNQYNKYNYPGNPSQYQGYNSSWWTGSSPSAMDPSQCQSLKNAGATISVLYIPYTVLTVTNQNSQETIQADNSIPSIPSSLQSCATSGYFYTANTPTDISNALAAMFAQAIQVAHLLK